MAKQLGPQLRQADLRIAMPVAKKADAELLTPEHRAWRRQVCDRAGWRCEHVELGQRCDKSRAHGDRMIADHVVERKDGGAPLDPKNGQCLCVQHNTMKGIAARSRRMRERY